MARWGSNSHPGHRTHCGTQFCCHLLPSPQHSVIPEELDRQPNWQQSRLLCQPSLVCSQRQRRRTSHSKAAVYLGATSSPAKKSAAKKILAQVSGNLCSLGKYEPESIQAIGARGSNNTSFSQVSMIKPLLWGSAMMRDF
jgi:hypothetical protein